MTFDQVRDAVAATYAGELATRTANEAAQAFAFQLYRDDRPGSAAFNQLLNAEGLSLTEIEPYTLSGASQRALSPEMLQSAFSLGGNRYYSDAYPISGGFAVLIYQGRIDAEIPAYETVAQAVAADLAADQKREKFNEKGEELKLALETALADEKDFVETAESLGLTAQTFEAFETQNPPTGVSRGALLQAQGMDAGELSPMLNLSEKGMGTILYPSSKPRSKQVLDIVVHSLYTDKEIFVRELVSNASDATEKLRHTQLTEKDVFDADLDLEIQVSADEEAGEITIRDFGIGMTRDEAHRESRHHRSLRIQGLPQRPQRIRRAQREPHRPVRCRLLLRFHGRREASRSSPALGRPRASASAGPAMAPAPTRSKPSKASAAARVSSSSSKKSTRNSPAKTASKASSRSTPHSFSSPSKSKARPSKPSAPSG